MFNEKESIIDLTESMIHNKQLDMARKAVKECESEVKKKPDRRVTKNVDAATSDMIRTGIVQEPRILDDKVLRAMRGGVKKMEKSAGSNPGFLHPLLPTITGHMKPGDSNDLEREWYGKHFHEIEADLNQTEIKIEDSPSKRRVIYVKAPISERKIDDAPIQRRFIDSSVIKVVKGGLSKAEKIVTPSKK